MLGKKARKTLAIGAISVAAFLGSATPAAAAENSDYKIGECYQYIAYENWGWYMVDDFTLKDSSGEVWTSTTPYAYSGSFRLNGKDLGLDEGQSDITFSVFPAIPKSTYKYTSDPIRYCENGRTVKFKSYGTIFNPSVSVDTE